jgi:hypothetical protein
MALHAPTLAFIDRAHTGGHDLASDIVLPDSFVDFAYLAIVDEDDPAGDGFTEVDDGNGPFWVWRKK